MMISNYLFHRTELVLGPLLYKLTYLLSDTFHVDFI